MIRSRFKIIHFYDHGKDWYKQVKVFQVKNKLIEKLKINNITLIIITRYTKLL